MPRHTATWASPFIAAALQKLLDVSAYRQVFNFLNGKPDYQTEGLLKRLQTQLLSVNVVLADAEEEKIMNPNVVLWVEKLQAALDDAENLWDEIVTETSGIKSNSSSHTLGGKLEQYFTSVNSRLEDIIKRLTEVVDLKDVIDLKEGKGKRESALSLPTTSFLDKLERVYGRDSDKDIITKYFSEEKGIIVVAIVGMAGVGKTTLSQLLFNAPGPAFNLKSWVYVSKRSSVLDLTQKIYASVISSSTGITDLNLLQKMGTGITDLNLLQKKLSSQLEGKRLLLVLDDFWSEKPQEWNLVKGPLTNGAPGSVIIVTTQNKNVALTLHATVNYTLPLLEFDDCQKIFTHHAFETEDVGGDETLKEIGEEIVRKCKGLPLSAKVLGSLLHSTYDPLEWDNILHSKIWDLPFDRSNILSSLLVSYEHLPLHLKRCFAFCSIFPKGQAIRKWILILLWMAHDLLPQSKTGKTIEKVGEEYLHELISRSFLQQSTNNDSDFVMHDLMSELAQYVSGEMFYKLEVGNLEDIPEKVRHLSFLQEEINEPEKLQAFHHRSQLRTFLPFRSLPDYPIPPSSNSLAHGSFQIPLEELSSLRVLSLKDFSISKLPDSIRKLKHLRFLNLSNTEITDLSSVVFLPNLVTLLLSECRCLTQLPPDLPKLINLRHLDVSGTSLEQMPPQFSRLKSLQMLTDFFVSKNDASRVSELGALTQLCGSVSIMNLQYVSNAKEASNANLKEMKFLKELKLRWTGNFDLDRERDVLDNLKPHKFLQKLKIERYRGIELPQWLGLTSFSNMVSVYLIKCENCSSLPPLGQLCSLETLGIAGMTRLKKVDSEFYGAHSTPFRSLKILSFDDMEKWEEWIPQAQLPSLQELRIRGCPGLKGNLNHEMPLLKKLVISKCKCLNLSPVATLKIQYLEHLHLESNSATLEGFSLYSFPALCHLHVEGCSSLRYILDSLQSEQDFPPLQNLVLKDCPQLKFFVNEQFQLQALEHLHLERSCNSLVSFPVCSFPELRELHIEGCKLPLMSLSEQDLHSLRKLVLKDCPNLKFSTDLQFQLQALEELHLVKSCNTLESFPVCSFPALCELHIEGCRQLLSMSPQSEKDLRSLKKLVLKDCPSLEFFANMQFQLQALEHLHLENSCDALTSFPLFSFPALCELHIEGCHELVSMSLKAGQVLRSLKMLVIKDCPNLKSLPNGGLRFPNLHSLHII